MANLIVWIEELAGGELVEAVVIGEMGWGDYGKERVPNYAEQPKGVLLSWEEAKRWLNYDFSDGYGAPECNAVFVWTTNKVMWVTQYDGSTCMNSAPRNPVAVMPHMPGGG